MTDPTHDAVDAAAQAAYAYHYGDGMWRYLNEGMRKVWREDAAVYLAAAAPILRRAWADQAAAPIQAEINALRVGANEFDHAQAEALEWAVEQLRTLGGVL